jgi:hypothetical protein
MTITIDVKEIQEYEKAVVHWAKTINEALVAFARTRVSPETQRTLDGILENKFLDYQFPTLIPKI